MFEFVERSDMVGQKKWGRGRRREEIDHPSFSVSESSTRLRKLSLTLINSTNTGRCTHPIFDIQQDCSGEILDELCVEFVIRVPRSASQLDRWFEVGQHVHFSRSMLGGIVSF